MLKNFYLFIILFIMSEPMFSQSTNTPVFTNDFDKMSYALGVNLAANLKSQGFDSINPVLFAEALDNAMKSKALKMTPAECSAFLNDFYGKMQQAKAEQEKAKYADNIKAGEDFLSKNKLQKGVVTLPSGLQYMVLKAGTGEKPKPTDKVKTHYHGTLLDGTVFDSSVDRGQPISFGVNQVIKGWTEALQLMPVGAKWKLFIPYNLAYGDRSAGKIPPYSTLIFEVELIGIEK